MTLDFMVKCANAADERHEQMKQIPGDDVRRAAGEYHAAAYKLREFASRFANVIRTIENAQT